MRLPIESSACAEATHRLPQFQIRAEGLAVMHVALESLVPGLHVRVVIQTPRSVDRLTEASALRALRELA
jgi:hypothetical protein